MTHSPSQPIHPPTAAQAHGLGVVTPAPKLKPTHSHAIARAAQRGMATNTIAITVVAVVVVVGLAGFWWSKAQRKKAVAANPAVAAAAVVAPPVKPSTAAASAPTPAAAPATTASPDRFGLTYGHGTIARASNPAGLMHSACAGTPTDLANPEKGACNTTKGDTSCRTALPLLCINRDNTTAQDVGLVLDKKASAEAAAPASTASTGTATASAATGPGWVGGSLGATAPVAGFVIGGAANGNARCERELGSGWKMAEIHDVPDSSGLIGKRGPGFSGPGSYLRHWIANKDQAANCWDPG